MSQDKIPLHCWPLLTYSRSYQFAVTLSAILGLQELLGASCGRRPASSPGLPNYLCLFLPGSGSWGPRLLVLLHSLCHSYPRLWVPAVEFWKQIQRNKYFFVICWWGVHTCHHVMLLFYACHRMCAEGRGQCVGVSCLLPCRFQGLNSGCQVW